MHNRRVSGQQTNSTPAQPPPIRGAKPCCQTICCKTQRSGAWSDNLFHVETVGWTIADSMVASLARCLRVVLWSVAVFRNWVTRYSRQRTRHIRHNSPHPPPQQRTRILVCFSQRLRCWINWFWWRTDPIMSNSMEINTAHGQQYALRTSSRGGSTCAMQPLVRSEKSNR
jgi:hypothetical protein